MRERLFTLASAGRPLVADLDRVSFIDAAGLGVLAAAARQAAAHGPACGWSAPGARSGGCSA
ncbi:MAG TPA: STAS domain-containing protein [Streptosporangiaceae bacterium]|nr:STAS domain-containing protein [Streptosporangiaceae bacterium]